MAKRKQRRDEFQDISSYSSKQAYKKNQKKKKRTGLKVFLSFICVILVLVGGVMIYASTVLLGDLKTTTITKDKTELGISEETKSEAGITNIALFGVDARDYDGGTFAGRSDAIMVMSIDNVIAIAGAAQQAHEAHQTMLVIFGLLVSVPFIVGGSQIIMKILDKFPVIVLFGGAMLGWIAGGLFTSDSFVVNHVPGVESWKMVAEVICALIVLLAGLYTRKKIAAKKAASAS